MNKYKTGPLFPFLQFYILFSKNCEVFYYCKNTSALYLTNLVGFKLFIFTFLKMYLVCVCAQYCMGISGQFERSQLFPSSMWVLESRLRFSGLVACVFTAESARLPKCVIASVYNIHFRLSHKINIPLKYEAL